MKMPSLCPICKDPLVNDFSWKPKMYDIDKACTKRLTHKLYIRGFCEDSNGNKDRIVSILLLDTSNNSEIYWSYNNHVSILKWQGKFMSENPIILPFFEPNFSNLKSLYTKLKLCITFS